VASVGLGVGLLLIAVAGVNAVNTQNARYAWLSTGDAATAAGAPKTSADPLWWLIRADRFDGELIGRIDVAATGPTSPVPPGLSHLPGPGQYYARCSSSSGGPRASWPEHPVPCGRPRSPPRRRAAASTTSACPARA
jgi:hypothetical protein